MTYLITIILFLLIISLILFKNNSIILNPIFLYIISWIALLIIFFFSGIIYNYQLKFSGILFICLSFLSHLIFFNLSKSTRKKVESNSLINLKFPVLPLFILSLIGCIFWTIDVFQNNIIIFGERINNFSISTFGVISYVFLDLSLIVWISVLFLYKRYSLKIPFYGFISFIIFILPAIITAGRQPLLVISVSTLLVLIGVKKDLSFSIRKKSNRFLTNFFFYIFSLGLFVIISSYAIFISNFRDITDDFDSKLFLAQLLSNMKVSNEGLYFLNLFGGLRSFILDLQIYYSHQLSMLQILIDYWPGRLFFGSVQFAYISRRFPLEWGYNKDFAYLILDQIAIKTNTYSHVWRTALGEYLIDFGYIGSLIFSSLMGFLMGKSYKNFINSKRINDFVMLIIFCVYSVFTIQASPFAESSWAYPLYWILLINFLKLKY